MLEASRVNTASAISVWSSSRRHSQGNLVLCAERRPYQQLGSYADFLSTRLSMIWWDLSWNTKVSLRHINICVECGKCAMFSVPHQPILPRSLIESRFAIKSQFVENPYWTSYSSYPGRQVTRRRHQTKHSKWAQQDASTTIWSESRSINSAKTEDRAAKQFKSTKECAKPSAKTST